jgi:chromosome partitioning protein
MIISFLNQKGGVGKSTLAINVAAALTLKKHRVLLIDADSQGSSSAWSSYREDSPFIVTALARENMAKDAIKMAKDYDFTIIDGPPHAREISRSIIISSDLVLMPIEPSGLSKWASDMTVEQIREAQEYKPELKAGFVVNRLIGNTVIGKQMRKIVMDAEMPILKTEIQNLVAFAESVTLAETIFEYAPKSSAAKQIKKLTSEIQRML